MSVRMLVIVFNIGGSKSRRAMKHDVEHARLPIELRQGSQLLSWVSKGIVTMRKAYNENQVDQQRIFQDTIYGSCVSLTRIEECSHGH